MKHLRKRLTAAMSALAVSLTMCGSLPTGSLLPDAGMITASAAVKTQCEVYSGGNVNNQNYSRWTNPIDSYLTVPEGGGFMRFQNGAVDGKYLIEYYDRDYNIQETVQIDAELPLFGGFYETADHYFVLSGQENPDELAETECCRITKYDKDWKWLDSVGLYNCDTTIPFDAGSARFAECGNYLLIRTCHEMYTSSDGLNHQANMTIQLDMESMEITDTSGESGYGYVSHSFNQFIHVEDNHIIALDHGDAYPRSLVLTRYDTDVSTGTFIPDYYTSDNEIDLVVFPGEIGENATGASVGGFEISDTSYIAAYSAENYEDGTVDGGTRNIVVGVVDKETDEVKNIRITDYEEGSASASTPHLVKTGDNSFVLLWSREDNVYYTALDGKGNPDEIYTIENASLSDCVPIVADGELVWYTWNNKVNTFYDIDTTDLSRHAETVIENGHRTEIISRAENAGEECTVHCTQCDQDFTFTTPTDVRIWWRKKGAFMSSTALPQSYIGDTIAYRVEFEGGDSSFLDYEMTISDTEQITTYPTGANEAELSLLKEGRYTITFVYPYCEAFNETFTLVVNHYADHTLVKIPAEEGTAIAKKDCQDCDYTEEFTVPSSIIMGIGSSDGYLSTVPAARYCPDADTKIGAYTNERVDNYEMTIAFSDPDIAVFTKESNYYYDLYGSIDWQKTGTVDVTIYPTYNPWVKQTFSLEIGHSYAEGICTECGAECPHESGYADQPTCQAPGTCAECGMEYGDTDPENHVSEEVKYVNSGSGTLHRIHRVCCDAFVREEPHQFTEESAGFCSLCEYECQHTTGNYTPADCGNANICNECGLTFGEIDPENHAGEETYFVPNAENSELHNIMYSCCDALKGCERHSFTLDEETGRYTCICGAEAAWKVIGDGEQTYYCKLNEALIVAETIYDSLVVPLFDMETEPFALTSSTVTLDLDGKKLSISSAEEQAYAVTVEDTSKLIIQDSKGGGEITAAEGMDLFCIQNGTLEIAGGTMHCAETLVYVDGTSNLYLNGGTLIGKTGVISENGTLYLYGKPDFQCTGVDFQIGSKTNIYIDADLCGAEYTISREEPGYFALLEQEYDFDDTWFIPQAENHVIVMKNNTIAVRYDLTKADIQLEQDELSYTGMNALLDITGALGDITLERSEHYEIEYTDADGNPVLPFAPGEYRAVLRGVGDFAGIVEIPFYITNATPLISWRSDTDYVFYNGETPELMPPAILLKGNDEFNGEIRYFYRIAGSEEEFTEGLPINAGVYELKAVIDAFGFYHSAETDSLLRLTIAKADALEFEPVEVSYSFTESGEKTIEMPELPRDIGAFGELEIDIIDPESLLDLEKSISYTKNTLTFHINQNPCTAYGKSAAIIITIPSQNYEDMELRANITMELGILTAEDFTFSAEDTVYSGTAKTAVLTPAEGVLELGEIKLTYYDENGDAVEPVTIGTYLVKAEINGGEYYESAELEDPDWTFTITPAIPEIAEPTAKAINYGQSLADSALTKGWTWADDSVIPTVKNDGFKAIYTVADTENYDYSEVEGFDAKTKTITRTISVTVTPAIPEIAEPTAKAINYGQSLADSALTKGWTWADDSIIPTVKNDGFKAIYAVADAENYDYTEVEGFDAKTKTITRTVSVTVTPAIPEITDPTAKAVVYGQTLADSALTKGWTWTDDSVIPTVKNDGFKAIYAVADAENYDYTEVEGFDAKTKTITRTVSVTVTPAVPEITDPTAKAITYGQSLADSALTKGWTWADDSVIPTVKNDGFKAIYAVADTENYDYTEVEGFDVKTNTITRTVSVTVTPAVPEITDPTAKAITYGQSLADSALTKGWTWADDSVIPTVKNDGFKAIYAVADTENYDYTEVEGFDAKTKTITRTVEVAVAKADPIVTPLLVGSIFTEGEKLPEITLSDNSTAGMIGWIDAEGILKVMENILEWQFVPEDAENYNEATGTMIVIAEATTTESATTETTTTESETATTEITTTETETTTTESTTTETTTTESETTTTESTTTETTTTESKTTTTESTTTETTTTESETTTTESTTTETTTTESETTTTESTTTETTTATESTETTTATESTETTTATESTETTTATESTETTTATESTETTTATESTETTTATESTETTTATESTETTTATESTETTTATESTETTTATESTTTETTTTESTTTETTITESETTTTEFTTTETTTTESEATTTESTTTETTTTESETTTTESTTTETTTTESETTTTESTTTETTTTESETTTTESTTTETTTTESETTTTESTTTETTTTESETTTTESTTTETTTTESETTTTESTTTETTTTESETTTTESTTTETTTTESETTTTESTTTETTTTESETTTTESTTTETTTMESETTTTESTTTETTTTESETTTTESTTTETTTTESETTTTESTTTESETTTTEPTVTSYTYTIISKTPSFWFSHDTDEFQPEDLIESITRFAVYSDGTVSETGEILPDLDMVSFDGLTPEMIWSDGGYEYSVSASITDQFGTQTIEAACTAYIGVKGDANLDGVTDAIDAAAVLTYAAAIGAGQDADLYSGTDESAENLAFFLAEVDGNANADAMDAAAILTYAAAIGSGEPKSWEEILGVA